jgi:hypothetical protein
MQTGHQITLQPIDYVVGFDNAPVRKYTVIRDTMLYFCRVRGVVPLAVHV